MQPPLTKSSGSPAPAARPRVRKAKNRNTLPAQGEPMLWLTGGALVIALAMIIGLIALVLWQGLGTFWPVPVRMVTLHDGSVQMGEVTRYDNFQPTTEVLAEMDESTRVRAESELKAKDGNLYRRLFRTGNFDLTGEHFTWVSDCEVAQETNPEWAVLIERLTWGRFYGTPSKFNIDGASVAESPADVWSKYNEHHADNRELWRRRRKLETEDIGHVNARQEAARIDLRKIELAEGVDSDAYAQSMARFTEVEAECQKEFDRIQGEIAKIDAERTRYEVVFKTAQGEEKAITLSEIVRAYPANSLSFAQKLSIYISRTWEFLTDEPREANSEGGVFPAIFGTVVMTLFMSILVVPFGVMAALYLHEYAKGGAVVSAVRIAINNLAGVPSIVFGVFGLGFFCYIVGGGIDQFFFEAKLPNPTFGKGGLIWASFTLALLTLPVVIVATEEALSAVPNSMREGSYACGAGKWQTIQRIVLPSALPGIMTGMILAMARGAGEVAPLMLVGAVKLAPELPIDAEFPFLHAQRSFMHLGFHIYDLGFQSQNSEAAKPMVFTTTLLLIMIVAGLNITAVWLRARLRRRLFSSKF